MDAVLSDFDARWNYDDPAASERLFRELLPLAEQRGVAAYRAELLTQIARAAGLQRKFAEAHVTLDEAQRLIGSVPAGADPAIERARVRCLLERGRALNTAGQPEPARALFAEAWELARARGEDGFAVDAAHMLAIVASADGQIEWNERALDLAARSDQPRARQWLGSLYNNLGWSYHDLGRYQDALVMFERALRQRQDRGEAGPIRIARWCVARAKRSLGRVEEALATQQLLLDELERAGASDGYVHEELGECLLALGRIDEARPHFARAYAELSADQWLAESEPERIERLRRLGRE